MGAPGTPTPVALGAGLGAACAWELAGGAEFGIAGAGRFEFILSANRGGP